MWHEAQQHCPAERLPEWLRRPIGDASALERVQGLVKQNRLHTICEEGVAPTAVRLCCRHGHIPAGWFDLHPQLRVLPGGERTGSDGG